MVCSYRQVAGVTTLFGKMSGGLGGGTIASVLGQLAESSKNQKGAAHPYSFNPPSDRSSSSAFVVRMPVFDIFKYLGKKQTVSESFVLCSLHSTLV